MVETQDSIITIAFNQTFREREFKVIASIGGNSTLRDTMIYKLIDTTKNVNLLSTVKSLELNAKLQGFWDGSTMNDDTVTLYLRSPLNPFNIADTAEVVLNHNGYALANFFNINAGVYYYLIVKHRNSIETWSKTTISFVSGTPITYDFTTSKTKAYGDNQVLKSGEYCIYGGDVDQNGSVNLTDILNIFNNSVGFSYGYDVTDVTGNNLTNLEDVLLSYNNSSIFVIKMRP